jgi:hypothetical protein
MPAENVIAPGKESAQSSTAFESGVSAPVFRRPTWYEAAVTCVILLLGALEGWYKRTDFSTDAISYLDIGRAIPLHDWKMVFNPLWSVGYPLLLSLARPLFPSTETGEWASIHAVNFVVFIACWLAFLFLLSSFHSVHSGATAEQAERRRRFTFFAGACIFVSIQLCIDSVSRVGPDLLVTTFFFLGTAMVIRFLRNPGYGRAAVLGLVLGLGYWVKGIFLPLSLTLLLVAAIALLLQKRRLLPAIVAGCVFAAVVAPYAAGLSWSFGKLTLGESGPLNYALHVNLLPRWTNWQGEPGGYGTPIHPTHQVLKNPDIFVFAEPYHNTYPPFGNIVYWYQGYRHFWSPRYQAIGIARDLRALVQALVPQPIFYAVALAVLLIFFALKDRAEWLRAIGKAWPCWVPAVVGILLYVQVHLEDRYLGSFLAIMCLIPFVTAAALPDRLPRWAQPGVLIVLAAGALLNYTIVDRDVLAHMRDHYTYAQNPQWKLALALERAGLKPGDKMAVVGGPNASCTWAYIAHLRIVAELGGEPFDQQHPVSPSVPDPIKAFWHDPPALQQKIVETFQQQTDAAAVIVSEKPSDVSAPPGWQHLEGTVTWIYRLR